MNIYRIESFAIITDFASSCSSELLKSVDAFCVFLSSLELVSRLHTRLDSRLLMFILESRFEVLSYKDLPMAASVR